jgi:hypothetical protein
VGGTREASASLRRDIYVMTFALARPELCVGGSPGDLGDLKIPRTERSVLKILGHRTSRLRDFSFGMQVSCENR